MTNNTASLREFGSFYYEPIDLDSHQLVCKQIVSSSKTVDHLYCFPYDVYVELSNGLATIMIGHSANSNDLRTFTVHHYLKIKSNVCFNIVPLSDKVTWYLITSENRLPKVDIPQPISYLPSSTLFNVMEVLDSYYVKDEPAYRFNKAAHAFYELFYVSRGSLSVTIGNTAFSLGSQDLVLLAPDPKHPKQIEKDTACSYLSIVFDMEIRDNPQITNHVFHCANGLQTALQKLTESSLSDSPYAKTLTVCNLQESITRLMQLCDGLEKDSVYPDAVEHGSDDLLQQIIDYMNERVAEPITIEEICHKFFLSRSTLQTLFKTNLNSSPKSYLINIKLMKSKELIRENQHTISEIADMLGFSSIHYFSRLFKKYYDMSPSDYAKMLITEKK